MIASESSSHLFRCLRNTGFSLIRIGFSKKYRERKELTRPGTNVAESSTVGGVSPNVDASADLSSSVIEKLVVQRAP